jgi:hypothetical protein
MTGEEGGYNDTILTSEFVYCTFLLKHTDDRKYIIKY